MSKKDLQAEARKLEAEVKKRATRIKNNVERGRLPRSALDYGFYSVYDEKKRKIKAGEIPKIPISRQNIRALTATIKNAQGILSLQTSTVAGIKRLRQEQAKTNMAILVNAGFSLDYLKGKKAKTISKIFQIAEMIAELSNKGSQDTLEETAELINDSGRSPAEILASIEKSGSVSEALEGIGQ